MNLERFVDELPILSVIRPTGYFDGIPYYEVTMRQFKQKLHRDLPPTTVWGYNGMYPGPAFEAKQHRPIYVKWKNNLPYEHLLPVDRTIHGAEPDKPSVRTVVHLHGGRVRPEDDGYPEAWFTRDFKNVGPSFLKDIYYYPNNQSPTALWYHDHALGITRLNVYAGLAGIYLLRELDEEKLNLPRGKYEIPLMIQDRSFYPNGELFYPSHPEQAVSHSEQPPHAEHPPSTQVNQKSILPNPSVVPEFFGDTILVNGKVWPSLEVEPRKYRFRILNGSNARFYRIKLSSGQDFTQIGSDGGFLEKPIIISEIILSPGERVDVIIDFSKQRGEKIIMTNSAPAPFPDGESPSGGIAEIMQFRVKRGLMGADHSSIPEKLNNIEKLSPNDAVTIRRNVLIESTDEFGRLKLLLNNMEWHEQPITETPVNGTVEIWELYNPTPDTHPIHLHLVQFQVLSRAPYTIDQDSKKIKIGQEQPPEPGETGWKDTIRANPGEVTRIIARFGPYTGIYPWHCHILEHEDHDMMRPYEVLGNLGDKQDS